MLDLKNQLPTALAALNADVVAQENRVPDAMATLARLSGTYAPSALATVVNNAAEASNRIDFAKSATATASSESTAADTTPAVVAARGAQEAVAQAKTLLDAVEKLSSDLADAAAQLPARLAPVQAELAAAKAAFGQGSTGSAGASISQRLQQVETALTAVAGPAGAKDPMLATQRVREADATLDDILAATRSAQETPTAIGRRSPAVARLGSGQDHRSRRLHQHPPGSRRQPGPHPPGRGPAPSVQRARPGQF